MSAFSIKNALIRGDLTFFVCMVVVIILPVYVSYLPPFMFLWGILWLFENNFKLRKSMFTGQNAGILFLLFICFYLWQISGLLLADNLESGFERICKRLSFFLFPFVLFYPGLRITENIKLLIRLFAIFTFIYLLYCFGNALKNSLVIQDGIRIFNPHPADYNYENFFYNLRLSYPAHPSYFSMYTLLSVLISLESFFDKSLNHFKRGIWLLFALIFLAGIYFLSSRAGFIASSVIIPLFILKKLYLKLSKWIVLSLIIISATVFFLVARTNKIINYSIEAVSKDKIEATIKNDIRVSIWKSALEVINQNLILGVGTGDASAELKKQFIKNGYSEGYYDNLNAHNQYLDILLENGIVGLIIFMTLLGFMIFYATTEENYVYLLFIVMMIIFFFFETVLNRMAGITFFSLFSFLLIHYKPAALAKN